MTKKDMTLEEKLEEAIVKDGPYEVPGNWVWTKLGEVCNKVQYGYTEKASVEKVGPHFLRITDIQENRVDWNSVPYCPISEKEYEKYKLDKGDIVIARTGATTGKNYIISDEVDSVFASYLIRMKMNNRIYNKFISYYMYSDLYWKQIMEEQKGIAQPGVNAQKLGELIVPIPPLKEQQRIVDKIEGIFEKLDKAKELIEEAREGFEKRKAAILEKAFRGELTEKWRAKIKVNLEEWEEKEFGKLGELERGRSKHRPRNAPELFGGEYPFIQTGDVANAKVYIKEHRQTLSELGLKQSRLFPKGTLCITIAANIGDVAILSYDCCFPDSVVGFTPNDNIDSKYIYYYMTVLKKEIESNAPATAQKNINLKILNDVKIKTPSLSEQKEIVRILDKLFEEESTIEELTQLEEQIELIKKSILAKAFRGQLGTNCEEDESAVELLKEILSKN